MIDMPATDALRRIRRVALGDFIHRSALKFGERTAVVDGDTRLNYRELDARSSRFAHHLIGTIGGGRQVGMLCANSADMVVAYNGIHKSGNVWVPVNIRLDVAGIDYILRHAEVAAVVVDEAFHAAPGVADMLTRLGVPLIVTLAAQAGTAIAGAVTLAQAEAGQSAELPAIDIDSNAPALIMYTSGTNVVPLSYKKNGGLCRDRAGRVLGCAAAVSLRPARPGGHGASGRRLHRAAARLRAR